MKKPRPDYPSRSNRTVNTIILPVTLLQNERELPTFALLDSGTEGSAFIDYAWVSEKNIADKKIPNPIILYRFNGDAMSAIRYYAIIDMRT